MKTRSFESVQVGEALPELGIPVTVTLIRYGSPMAAAGESTAC